MELLGEDLLLLLKAFEQNHLKYIIVGGFATNFHGHHRATGDIDFWIQDTGRSLNAYEFKWNPAENYRTPKAWKESYQNANYQVIHPRNYSSFLA